MKREGARVHTVSRNFEIQEDIVDVTLAGIRIEVSYSDSDKTFFVAVGSPTDKFSGRDGIPIGKLYDALLPLTGKATKWPSSNK